MRLAIRRDKTDFFLSYESIVLLPHCAGEKAFLHSEERQYERSRVS